MWVGPGNWESPWGDKLILGGAILAVDILNAAADGGSGAEVQDWLSISQRLQYALHLPTSHFLLFSLFFFTSAVDIIMLTNLWVYTHHNFLWYFALITATAARNSEVFWAPVSLLYKRYMSNTQQLWREVKGRVRKWGACVNFRHFFIWKTMPSLVFCA